MDANKNLSNHRYHFIGEDHIVSAEEHEYILDALKSGKTQVILRGGSLIMNLTLGFSAVETGKLTDEQERKKDETLKIEGPKYIPATPEESERRLKVLEAYKTPSTGFSHVAGKGEMKKCLDCGVPHFIPAQRTLCLPCLIKK